MKIKSAFEKQGWVGPLPVLSEEEIALYQTIFKDTDQKLNLMNSDYRCKSNVLFPWIDKISRHPTIISYLTEIIGPNIFCWDTLIWIKHPNDKKIVSFHQDGTYWNFDNKLKAATVWMPFNDVFPNQGSIEYIQESHQIKQKHKDIKTPHNLLMRGQTVDTEIPENRVITAVPAGNILIHSPYMIHGSNANTSEISRMAIGMIFASTECKPILNISPESAVLVSGVDSFNHMLHDPKPTGVWEFDLKSWQRAYDRQHDNYYQMGQHVG